MVKPSLLTGQVQVISVPPSHGLRAYTKELAARAELVRARRIDPTEDNLLKITSDGRKASVFNNPPNLWPTYPIRTKVDECSDRIWSHYIASDADSGAQLVFCDLYTPKVDDSPDAEYLTSLLSEDERFALHGVYGRLKTQLVNRGILPNEIAFAHDYDTPRDRARLHSLIRSGDIRVCVGSTALIGVSVNVQERGVALHHLDCPWRPDELEQRTARFVRQGNKYGEVAVYVYVTEGSYDPVVWQIVEGKARWISQLLSGRVARKTVEDVGAVVLTASLAKAVALGDSRVLEKTRIEMELTGLERRWLAWCNSRSALRRDADRLPSQIERLRVSVRRFTDWAELVSMPVEGLGLRLLGVGLSGLAHSTVGVASQVSMHPVATLQDGNTIVRQLWLQYAHRQQSVLVGEWRGFKLWLEPRHGSLELTAYPSGALPDGSGVTVSGVGFQAARPIDAMGQLLTRSALEQEARLCESKLRGLETRLDAVRAELGVEWPMRTEVERLLSAYERVCTAVPATVGEDGIVREALAELQDRVSFRFRWE